ncbi:MAG: radical SAM protein [Candidatus Aenigmarchaeota archaeon]|nr:radical SAM protein [Candidatus Aenigmarchaeota archaeon]
MEKDIADRILKWLSKGEVAPPHRVELDPTNKCNLMCLACVARGKPVYDASKELTKYKWLKIIREAIQLGAKSFNISGGGEPLCRPKTTLTIMKEIKKYNLIGSLVTNGTLFTKEIVKKLVRIRWDEIRFSIDGPDAKTHDYLRDVPGTFDRAIESIKFFTFLKKKLNRSKPRIHITPVITSQNFNRICEMIELVHDLGADALYLQPFMSGSVLDIQSNKEKRRQISKRLRLNNRQQKEFREHLKKARRLAEKYRITTNFDFLEEKIMKETTDVIIRSDSKEQPQNSILSIPCFFPWFLLQIHADGIVEPCGGNPVRESIKQKSLREIWYGELFNKLRRELIRKQIPSCCKACCPILVYDIRSVRKALFEITGENIEKLTFNSKMLKSEKTWN